MPYCKINEKATIKYKLGDKERVFEAPKTPIEVSVYQKPIQYSENFNPQGYALTFYSTNNRAWFVGLIVVDYIIKPQNSSQLGTNQYPLFYTDCFDGANNRVNLKSLDIDITTLTIDNQLKCSSPVKNRCYIEVKYNDLIVFIDQGDCPASFEVQCGDCPEGTIRCDSPGYPGYCCIPCAELAQRVNAMTRRLNV